MRVLLVGDSHSQALWPRVRPWAEGRGHVVRAISNAGWSEQRYLNDDSLWQAIEEFRPDGVVVELGGNNRLAGRDYETLLRTFVERCQTAGANVVWWVGPSTAIKQPWRGTHDASAETQARVLPTLPNVRWLDSRPFTTSGQRDDGVHFTSAAYARWAQEIQAFLVRPVVLMER